MISKIALVTGGTRGIGEAISLELKEKGFFVIATYGQNHEAARAFSQKHDIETICFNVSDPKDVESSCQKIIQQFGRVDVLVHNAGVTADVSFLKMTHDQWRKVLSTNLDSAFYLTKGVIETMKQNHFGRLIFLSSVNALKGQRGQANYTASKAGLIGFAKSIALEFANKGITSNVIAPGYVDTDMVRAIPLAILEKIISQIPINRLGRAEEIAHIVSFLADEQSAFVTGSVISANGGMY